MIALSKGGNKAFNSKFLAKRDPRELLPDGNRCDINVLRKFIKCKYYDRKWFDDSNDSPKEEQGQDQEQVSDISYLFFFIHSAMCISTDVSLNCTLGSTSYGCIKQSKGRAASKSQR